MDRQEIDEIAFRPNVFKFGRLFRSVNRGQFVLNSANSICFHKAIQINLISTNFTFLHHVSPLISGTSPRPSRSFSLGSRRSTDGIPANGVCTWETYANEQNHPIGSDDTLCKWKEWQNHSITGHVCNKTTHMQIFESKNQIICFEHLASLAFQAHDAKRLWNQMGLLRCSLRTSP